MVKLGYTTGDTPVYFDKENGTISVAGTDILITGVTRENCLELAERNLKEFYDFPIHTYCPVHTNPYQRTKAQVYATGNKWAIENFNATHN